MIYCFSSVIYKGLVRGTENADNLRDLILNSAYEDKKHSYIINDDESFFLGAYYFEDYKWSKTKKHYCEFLIWYNPEKIELDKLFKYLDDLIFLYLVENIDFMDTMDSLRDYKHFTNILYELLKNPYNHLNDSWYLKVSEHNYSFRRCK